MQLHFNIRPSLTQLGFILAGHASIALAITAYTEPVTMMLGGLLVVGLLALRESRRLWQQGEISLAVNPRTASIELKLAGQPYFFCKYKVYATRWFAILKLNDNRKTRTLILNPDRFNSIQSYRQLRLLLQTMDRADAA